MIWENKLLRVASAQQFVDEYFCRFHNTPPFFNGNKYDCDCTSTGDNNKQRTKESFFYSCFLLEMEYKTLVIKD